jgi:hypothetical protein
MSLKSRAIIEDNKSVLRAQVLAIGVDGRVLHFVEWKRAALMLASGQVYTIETVKRRGTDGTLEEVLLRSPSMAIPLPLIVGLLPHVRVPAIAFTNAKTERAGRRAILDRDGKICTYCNRPGARTIDHILPKSRGGKSTWQNLVAACGACNTAKADRTPEEAGMVMHFDPRVEEGGAEDLQAEVWQYLDAAAGVIRP